MPFSRSLALGIVVGLVAAGIAGVALLGPATANHLPANKVSVSGSTVEVMSASFSPLAGGQSSEVVSLLSGTVRSSHLIDLLISATLECALWTDITTVGNNQSQAVATVKAWVEVDGEAVPVAGDDDGKVVFCNRDYKRVTTNFDDENAQIQTFLRTRAANSFNWFALDLGYGVHTIELKAQLETEVQGTGNAKAAVGKRTLVVEPEQLANDISV